MMSSPQSYQKIPANHVIHAIKPKEYADALTKFARAIQAP